MWLYFYENTFSLFKRGQEFDKLTNLLQTIEYNLWPRAFFQFESVFFMVTLCILNTSILI